MKKQMAPFVWMRSDGGADFWVRVMDGEKLSAISRNGIRPADEMFRPIGMDYKFLYLPAWSVVNEPEGVA